MFQQANYKLYMIAIFFAVLLSGCKIIQSEYVSPPLNDIDNYDIVYFDTEEDQIRFVTIEGEKSELYEFAVIIPGYKGNTKIKAGSYLSMFTWSPDGGQLAFLARPYSPSGVPVLFDLQTNEFSKCSKGDLPVSKKRVWIVNENEIIAVDNQEEIDKVVILNFDSCFTDVIYQGNQKEYIYEAALSSSGWLAIGEYVEEPVPRYQILIQTPEGENYSIENASFPAWSRDGEQLAFFLEGDGLYISDKTGGSQTFIEEIDNLTFDTDWPEFTSWSPDGHALVFSEMNNIYIYWIESNTKILLVEGGVFPNWRWVD